MKPIPIIQGDLARPFKAELTLSGVVPSSTPPDSITFHLENEAGSAVDRTASLVSADATKWTVQYWPVAEDVAAPGDYKAQWRLTFSGGKSQSFPDDGYIEIKIIRKIGE